MQRPTALVTGGAKRVGRAIAQTLVRHGFDVAITYRTSLAEATDFEGLAIPADFDTLQDLPRIEAQIREKLSRLDLLVNNASLYLPDDQPGAERQMQVNFVAPMALSRRLAPLIKQAHGAIVNFIDVLAERPMKSFSQYCASKAALANGTLAMARELAPDVRVNGVAPGVIDWPVAFPEDEKRKYLTKVPLARAGTPEEAADLVHFLATRGTYITGQIIRLDGGRSITW